MKRLIHRNEPNRPHISSFIINFKQRRDNNERMRRNFLARPACIISVYSLRLVSVPFAFLRWPGSFGAPVRIPALPVRGVLRLVPGTRKPFFTETAFFFRDNILFNNIICLRVS